MSAQVEIVQQQRTVGYKQPPDGWKPGQSGNPGGRPKGTPSIDRAIQRLIGLSPAERAAYEPVNGAEEIALARIAEAGKSGTDLQYGHGVPVKAAEFIADRVDGPVVRQTAISVNDTTVRAHQDYQRERLLSEREGYNFTHDELVGIVCEGYEQSQRPLIERELAALGE